MRHTQQKAITLRKNFSTQTAFINSSPCHKQRRARSDKTRRTGVQLWHCCSLCVVVIVSYRANRRCEVKSLRRRSGCVQRIPSRHRNDFNARVLGQNHLLAACDPAAIERECGCHNIRCLRQHFESLPRFQQFGQRRRNHSMRQRH